MFRDGETKGQISLLTFDCYGPKTIDQIRRLNPQMAASDNIGVGQELKLSYVDHSIRGDDSIRFERY